MRHGVPLLALKAHPHWHTSSSKTTPPKPSKQHHQLGYTKHLNAWDFGDIIQTTTLPIKSVFLPSISSLCATLAPPLGVLSPLKVLLRLGCTWIYSNLDSAYVKLYSFALQTEWKERSGGPGYILELDTVMIALHCRYQLLQIVHLIFFIRCYINFRWLREGWEPRGWFSG